MKFKIYRIYADDPYGNDMTITLTHNNFKGNFKSLTNKLYNKHKSLYPTHTAISITRDLINDYGFRYIDDWISDDNVNYFTDDF